jgi:hypothetical protein
MWHVSGNCRRAPCTAPKLIARKVNRPHHGCTQVPLSHAPAHAMRPLYGSATIFRTSGSTARLIVRGIGTQNYSYALIKAETPFTFFATKAASVPSPGSLSSGAIDWLYLMPNSAAPNSGVGGFPELPCTGSQEVPYMADYWGFFS